MLVNCHPITDYFPRTAHPHVSLMDMHNYFNSFSQTNNLNKKSNKDVLNKTMYIQSSQKITYSYHIIHLTQDCGM